MKLLKQLFFISIFTLCFSFAAMAQKQGDDKKNERPPKNNPEIKPGDKNQPKNDQPKNDNNNRPKKPQLSVYKNSNQIEINFV